MIKRFSPDQLIYRAGGWSLIILIAIAQTIALLGAAPGILSIRFNAALEGQQLLAYSTRIPMLIALTYLLLLGLSWQITSVARKRLDEWVGGVKKSNPDDEFLAWREITSLSWRYGIAAVFLISVIVILPALFISFAEGKTISSALQPNSLNASDPAYILVGGFASVAGSVILAILMIERFTLP